MSQRPPPNRYIVVQYVTKPDADAYERLKHEWLRGEAAVALLQQLYKDALDQTVKNTTQQMLLSDVRVSKKQCPKLQATLARA